MAQLKVEQSVLRNVVAEVEKFTNRKFMLVRVEKEQIVFIGSNDEITIERVLPLQNGEDKIGEVKEEGEFLLPNKFGEVVRKFPSGQVSIKLLKNNQIEVKSGKSSVKINGIEGENPTLPEVDESAGVGLTTEVIKLLIDQTAFAAADNENRPILKSIHFNSGDGFKVIATDSHRLAQKHIPKSLNLPTLNIPAKGMKDMASVLEEKAKVSLHPSGNYVLFKTDNKKIFMRQIEGSYPDVTKLIPESSKTTVEIEKEKLIKAIDRCSLFADDKKNKSITISISADMLKLSASEQESGQIEDEVAAKVEGDEVTLALNSKFMSDALNAFQAKTVKLLIDGPERPVVVKSEEDHTLTQLVLPIKTN